MAQKQAQKKWGQKSPEDQAKAIQKRKSNKKD